VRSQVSIRRALGRYLSSAGTIHEHKHRNLKFVSPAQRHYGTDQSIFAKRVAVYEQARKKHPARWRPATRDWSLPNVVWLNRPADDQLLGKAA
jgi:putative transposase